MISQGDPLGNCESARLKLARAQDHLDAYERAWRDFTADGYPYGYRSEINDDRTCITLYLQERRIVPRDFGLIVGDCVHNLRSALDHLAYALPRAAGTDPRWEKWSQWPIFDDPNDFAGAAKRWLCGVDGGAVAGIETCQPYYRPNGPTRHPLRYLAELSNLDKHRVLHGIALPGQRASLGIDLSTITGDVWPVFNDGGIEPNAIVGKVYFTDPAPKPVEMEVSVTFAVAIDGLEPPIGVQTVLDDIHGFITYEAFPAVEPFLP